MSFQRARTEQQKNARLTEIKQATIQLYNTIGFSDITLTRVANDLSFSRVNLYKYYKTSEEIFLNILLDDLTLFSSDLKGKIDGKTNLPILDFAEIFTDTILKQRRMLHLLTLDLCIMEKKLAEDKLLAHKAATLSLMAEIAEEVTRCYPQISIDQSVDFINSLNYYSRGLYAAVNLNASQHKVLEELEAGHMVPDYKTAMAQFIVIHLGYYVNAQQEQGDLCLLRHLPQCLWIHKT